MRKVEKERLIEKIFTHRDPDGGYVLEGRRKEKERVENTQSPTNLDRALLKLLQPNTITSVEKVKDILRQCYPSFFPLDELDDLFASIEKEPQEAKKILRGYLLRRGFASLRSN